MKKKKVLVNRFNFCSRSEATQNNDDKVNLKQSKWPTNLVIVAVPQIGLFPAYKRSIQP